MTATKQELRYTERLLIRRALALLAGRLREVRDLTAAEKDEIKISDELQQQFKDASEITLMFDD